MSKRATNQCHTFFLFSSSMNMTNTVNSVGNDFSLIDQIITCVAGRISHASAFVLAALWQLCSQILLAFKSRQLRRLIKSFLGLSMLSSSMLRTKHRAKGFGGNCVVWKVSRILENL